MHYVTTPATTSYVPVAELKTHLLLFGDTSYDTELQDILLASEDFLSDFLGEYITDTTIRLNVSSFGDTTLPHKIATTPVVTYWDTNNTAQVHASSNYVIDTSGTYPVIKFTTVPTGLSATFDNAGYVTYVTSMLAVPSKLNRAILVIAGEMFENRFESSEKKMEKVQLTAMRLIQSLRGW